MVEPSDACLFVVEAGGDAGAQEGLYIVGVAGAELLAGLDLDPGEVAGQGHRREAGRLARLMRLARPRGRGGGFHGSSLVPRPRGIKLDAPPSP